VTREEKNFVIQLYRNEGDCIKSLSLRSTPSGTCLDCLIKSKIIPGQSCTMSNAYQAAIDIINDSFEEFIEELM
jgi:hypothetical protein